jgi:hypothetical protein
VTVDAPTPARLQGRELLLAWRPAAGARGLDATCVHDRHGLVVRHGIQPVFVSGDERLPLRFGELAGNDFRLVICETQTMQERNPIIPEGIAWYRE